MQDSDKRQQRLVTCAKCYRQVLFENIGKHQRKSARCHGAGVRKTPDLLLPARRDKFKVGLQLPNPPPAAQPLTQHSTLSFWHVNQSYWGDDGPSDLGYMEMDEVSLEDFLEQTSGDWPTQLLKSCCSSHIWDGEVLGYRAWQRDFLSPLRITPVLSTLRRIPRPAQEIQRFKELAQRSLKELRARLSQTSPVSSPSSESTPSYSDRATHYFAEYDKQVQKAAKDANVSQLAVLEYVQDCMLSEENATKLLKLLSRPDFDAKAVSFLNWKQFLTHCRKITPDLLKMSETPVTIPGKDGTPVTLTYPDGRPIILYHRNVFNTALLMARDSHFSKHLVTQPTPQFRALPDGKGKVRVYNSLSSGLLFQEMCRTAPPQHTVIAPILYSDASTRLSRLQAWPIYSKIELLVILISVDLSVGSTTENLVCLL